MEINDIKFNFEKGEVSDKELTLYALSTCAFCKKAMSFLKENSISFSYLNFDELDEKAKDKLEEKLSSEFNDRLAFPFLVIDSKKHIVGFDEKSWREALL